MNQQKTDRIRPLAPSFAPRVGELLKNQESQEGEDFLEAMFHAIVKDAVKASASDIHLDQEKECGCLRLRVDGALHDVSLIPQKMVTRIVNHFKVNAELNPGPTHTPEGGWADYPYENRIIHLRISCTPTVAGDKLSIRLFDESQILSEITELGLKESQSELIDEWLGKLQGLFLVVGSVGSGKSTTLYALLRQLRKEAQSVVTIEDPVEYRVDGINQIQVSPDHGFDFPEALKSTMRLDPDDIMLGEIRDPLSATAAIDAAATGKVLLSTLHSRDAVGAVTSLRNYEIKDYEIAALLEVVVSQRLVRKLCTQCKKEVSVSKKDQDWLKSIDRKAPKKLYVPNEDGCEACGGVGYKGRTGVFEVWRLREKDKGFLMKHPPERVLRDKVRKAGLPSLFDASWDLVTSGVTSLQEIRPFAEMMAEEG